MMAIMKKFRNRDGFSLVEVLVAVVILAIAGAALLKLIQGTTLGNRALTNKTVAYAALNKAVSQVKSAPFVNCTKNSSGAGTLTNVPAPSAFPKGVTTTDGSGNQKIEFLAPNGSWVSCATWWSTTTNNQAPTLERITVTASYYTSNQSTSASGSLQTISTTVIKTTANKFSSVKIKTSLSASKITDLLRNGTSAKTFNLDVSPLSCSDVFLWNSTATGVVSVTVGNCVNSVFPVSVTAVRTAALAPFPHYGSLVFSGVNLPTNELLYEASVSLDPILFPDPNLTSFKINSNWYNSNTTYSTYKISSIATPHTCVDSTKNCGSAFGMKDNVTVNGTYLLGNVNDQLTYPTVALYLGNNPVTSITPTLPTTDTSLTFDVPNNSADTLYVQTQSTKDSSNPPKVNIPHSTTTSFQIIPQIQFTTMSGSDPVSEFNPPGGDPNTSASTGFPLNVYVRASDDPGWIQTVLFLTKTTVNGRSITTYTPSTLYSTNTFSNADHYVQVKVPAGVISGHLIIVTGSGFAYSQSVFTPAPTITSVQSISTSTTGVPTPVAAVKSYTQTVNRVTTTLAYGSGYSSTPTPIQINGTGLSADKLAVMFWDGTGYNIPGSDCGYNAGHSFFYFPNDVSTSNLTKMDTEIGTCVPLGAKAGKIEVINNDTDEFGLLPVPFHPEPIIQSFTQGAGEGVTVTIRGSGFSSLSSLYIGSYQVGNPTVSDQTVTFKVPSDITINGIISITTPIGTDDTTLSTSLNPFLQNTDSVFYALPRITSVSITSAQAGDSIQINGTGFTNFKDVSVNGNKFVSLSSNTGTTADTKITGNISCSMWNNLNGTTNPISITTNLGDDTGNSQNLTIKSSLSPSITNYGTNSSGTNTYSDKKWLTNALIKISGSGLCSKSMQWNGNTLSTSITNNIGNEVTATLPVTATKSDYMSFDYGSGSFVNSNKVLYIAPKVTAASLVSTTSIALPISSISVSTVNSVKRIVYNYCATTKNLFKSIDSISITNGYTTSGFNGSTKTAIPSATLTQLSFSGAISSFTIASNNNNSCGNNVTAGTITISPYSGTATTGTYYVNSGGGQANLTGSLSIAVTGQGFGGCSPNTISSCTELSITLVSGTNNKISSSGFTNFTDTNIQAAATSSVLSPGTLTIVVTSPYGNSSNYNPSGIWAT